MGCWGRGGQQPNSPYLAGKLPPMYWKQAGCCRRAIWAGLPFKCEHPWIHVGARHNLLSKHFALEPRPGAGAGLSSNVGLVFTTHPRTFLPVKTASTTLTPSLPTTAL